MSTTDPMFDPSDLDQSDYYCVHGTFIGNPYGADYLCFHCEMGTSPEEYRQAAAIQGNRARRSRTAGNFLAEAFGSAEWQALGPEHAHILRGHYWRVIMGIVAALGRFR